MINSLEQYRQNRLAILEQLFQYSNEGVFITGVHKQIIDMNSAFTSITGYTREEALGHTLSLICPGFYSKEYSYYKEWQKSIENGDYWYSELQSHRKNGEIYPARLSLSVVRDEQGEIVHYIGILSDISVQKQHEKQIEYIAHYDVLTGIPNATLLVDRLRLAIAQAQRDQKVLAICYLDLDGFKQVNDQLGHTVGDQALIEMARRIKAALRDVDTVARLGGDEFAILLGGQEEPDLFNKILDRLLYTIARPISVMGEVFLLTASIGVTLFPYDSDEPDTLLRHADQAMYTAKQLGKNCYYRYDPFRDQRQQKQLELRRRIEQGLANSEFELYFQPIVQLRTGKVIAAEALIRWHHPDRGLLYPGEFLPAVVHTELEILIGEWVIDTTLVYLENWNVEGILLDISVNLSSGHLQSPGFLENLQDRLESHPTLSRGRLQFDVLETTALEAIFGIRDIIQTCSAWGISFALDDFGTGYSSLSYLRSLPIDTLKIDQTFVRGLLKDTGDAAIVRGIIGLAQAFGRKIIAEGVESLELAEALIHLGCEVGQGFGIASPMPPEKFVEWCKRNISSTKQ